MSRLTKLHKKILTNFNTYISDAEQIKLLAANISLFEEIPDSYLKKLFKRISAFDLLQNNQVLLIVADSYIQYALENKNTTNLNDLLILLNKAAGCFQRIINANESLPPALLNQEHSEQLLIAKFQLHKIKFLEAEMRLFFIEKEIKNNSQNIAWVRRELREILNEYTYFKRTLAKYYKDSTLRSQLSINDTLLHSIDEGFTLAKNLLDNLPPQTTKRRQLEAVPVDDGKADENTEDLSQAKRNKKDTSDNQTSTSNTENSNPSSELTGLDLLSAYVAEVAPMELNDENTMVPPMSEPNFTPQIFWTQPPSKSTTDSRKFLTEFNQWSSAYFHTRSDYSDAKKTKKALEKIAHALLFAAIKLQKESSIFKDQQFNPAIQIAVQLFSLACVKEAKTTSEATEKLGQLSKTYAPLLRPFVRSFFHKTSPEKFISHLRNQFMAISQTNVSCLGLEPQELVEQLFKHLETVLTADDYEKVTQCCLDCVTQAHMRLEHNSLPSHK